MARPIPGAPPTLPPPPDAKSPPGAIAALEALPPVSAFPPSALTADEDAETPTGAGLEGEVSTAPPLPPARPADLAKLAALEAASTPLPPRRPTDLAERASASQSAPAPPSSPKPEPLDDASPQDAAPAAETPAQPPQSAAAPSSPAPPARPRDRAGRGGALQQVARLPEPTAHGVPDLSPSEPEHFGLGSPVFIRIFKQEGQLELYLRKGSRFALYKTYPICKWSGHLGPKIREADYQSPEGFYSVSAKQLHPHSNYHRAFNLGYPNAYDRQNGRTGGLVMVHGNCKSVGCFAMTDAGIEEIYGFVDAALRAGQKEIPVHIFPFHMTEQAIARETGGGFLSFASTAGGAQWGAFWRNLKEGYDLFEQTGEPPVAYACGDHYSFGAAGAACQRVAGW
ncbi:MAG: murein L,D-transpeptidase [Methylocystis sp.]|nr:murein L,D-transpeptidase [Methylocystis sp.]